MPATYRYEISNNSRAQCQVQQCKDNGEKIQKGEFRFGSLVTIQEHTGWKWKHWGCVTPSQISTIIDQLGGLDGLDLDSDLDILDGYEELPTWAQDKIKYALKHGHVHNEDWKGDPELNVPGARGLRKTRTPKKKAKKDVDEENDNEETSPVPKANKGRPKKVVTDKDDGDEEPAKQKATGKKRKAEAVEDGGEEAVKPKRSLKKAKAPVKDEEPASDVPLNEPKKRAQKKGKGITDDAEPTETPEDNAKTADKDSEVKGAHRKSTKKVKDEVVTEEVTKPTRGRPRKVKEAATEDVNANEAEDNEAAKSSKSRRSKKAKEEPTNDDVENVVGEEATNEKPKRGQAKSKAKSK